ncbi:TnpV protein [Oliverpabstia intestinalis]
MNEQTQCRLRLIIRQMQEAEFVTEKLKEENRITWVQVIK